MRRVESASQPLVPQPPPLPESPPVTLTIPMAPRRPEVTTAEAEAERERALTDNGPPPEETEPLTDAVNARDRMVAWAYRQVRNPKADMQKVGLALKLIDLLPTTASPSAPTPAIAESALAGVSDEEVERRAWGDEDGAAAPETGAGAAAVVGKPEGTA